MARNARKKFGRKFARRNYIRLLENKLSELESVIANMKVNVAILSESYSHLEEKVTGHSLQPRNAATGPSALERALEESESHMNKVEYVWSSGSYSCESEDLE